MQLRGSDTLQGAKSETQSVSHVYSTAIIQQVILGKFGCRLTTMKSLVW